MAEETPGFNPLDNLGEGYGGLNQIPMDAKSLQPFEGDLIDQPKIDFQIEDLNIILLNQLLIT